MVRSEKAQKAFDKLVRDASGFEPSIKKFFLQYASLCIIVVVIWILFFALGLPMVIKYGYSSEVDRNKIDNMSQTATGSIASGVYGSGIFPYSLFLFIISTALLIKELVCYFKYPSVKELERRVDMMIIEKRLGSMRQMSSLHREDMMSIGVDAASLNPAD